MRTATSLIFCASVIAGLAATPAVATPCPALTSCTVGGITYNEVGTSGDGLTFLASFTAPNLSNSTIATDVEQFLTAEGFDNVLYLGRQNGTGLIDGDSITTSSSDGGFTGTWTLSPGTTGDVGSFVAIHAGDGKFEQIFQIDDPGLSGTWSTFNSHGLSEFDLFGTPAPPSSDDPPPSVPEPLTLSLFGAGLAGTLVARRRKKTLAG